MPRPVSVPRSALPEMLVLGSERYGQWGVDANTLDYERFGSKIWQDDGAGTSVELNAQKYFTDFLDLEPTKTGSGSKSGTLSILFKKLLGTRSYVYIQ